MMSKEKIFCSTISEKSSLTSADEIIMNVIHKDSANETHD